MTHKMRQKTNFFLACGAHTGAGLEITEFTSAASMYGVIIDRNYLDFILLKIPKITSIFPKIILK
jgi:hypothetical protein